MKINDFIWNILTSIEACGKIKLQNKQKEVKKSILIIKNASTYTMSIEGGLLKREKRRFCYEMQENDFMCARNNNGILVDSLRL